MDNYVEPFFGSGAALLGRPDWHAGRTETVNDKDCFLANFWRALEHAPEEVAFYADRPVNECDLFAIHLWLVNSGRERIAKMEADPDFYDAQVAGWFVWGLNSWIGSGWCRGQGPWQLVDGKVALVNGSKGGQFRQLPHLGDAGHGTNRQLSGGIYDYFQQLAARLRKVRVCCGDWARIVTNGALSYGETVGVFLDPPYLGEVRKADLYAVDDHEISHAVRDWCLANGDNPRYRIVLAGYKAEHDDEMPGTWRRHFYSASASYMTTASAGSGKGNVVNRHNEVLWFSPGCLSEKTLF